MYGAVVKVTCCRWSGLPQTPVRGAVDRAPQGPRGSRLSALSANRQLTAGRIDPPPVTDGKAR